MQSDWSIIEDLYRHFCDTGQSDPKIKALFHGIEFVRAARGGKEVTPLHDHDIEDIVTIFNTIMKNETQPNKPDILQ